MILYHYHLVTLFMYSMFVQVALSLLFSLVIAFVSVSLNTAADNASMLTLEDSFKNEFHEIVRQ